MPITKRELRDSPIVELVPNPRNPRRIADASLERIADSMRTFGFGAAVLVRAETSMVIAGHQRIRAARLAGFDTVPAQWVWGLTDEEADALNIADNRLGEEAQWDRDLLATMLEEMAPALRSATGMSDQDLAELLNPPPPHVDDIPDPPKDPIAQRGELWELGDHRLLCGDATDPDAYRRLLGTAKASLVFTDPPYGVDYADLVAYRPGQKAGGWDDITGDQLKGDDLLGLLVPAFKLMEEHAGEGAAFYVWHASSTRDEFSYALKAAGLEERQYLIWAKPSMTIGNADYQWAHEPCFYASRAGERPAFHGGRATTTVWRVSRIEDNGRGVRIAGGVTIGDGQGHELYVSASAPKGRKVRRIRLAEEETAWLEQDRGGADLWEVSRDTTRAEHPTQKPVELAARALANSSLPGQVVLDPFLGSGTTLIAAERTGRRCHALELEPRYVDVTVKRWEQLTGKHARKIEEDAETHEAKAPAWT
jgi:DNA modification methylase